MYFWGPDSSTAVRMAVVYLTFREGEEQKEVLEAEGDKEKESEEEGEVEERERESINVCMRHDE